MKKDLSFFAGAAGFLSVCATFFLLASCSNFLNGSELKNEIDSAIDYENAAKFNVRIDLANLAQGTITPSGDRECRVGDSFEIEFTMDSAYNYDGTFLSLSKEKKSTLDGAVKFSNETRYAAGSSTVIRTTVTILKESSDILIRPKCSLKSDNVAPEFYTDEEWGKVFQAAKSKKLMEQESLLSAVPFDSWSGDELFQQNHTGGVFFRLCVLEEDSEIESIVVTETLVKDKEGNDKSLQSVGKVVPEIEKQTQSGVKLLSADYDFATAEDGILRLDVAVMDSKKNLSDSKTLYVLKDTTLDISSVEVKNSMVGRNTWVMDESSELAGIDYLNDSVKKFRIKVPEEETWYSGFTESISKTLYWGLSKDSITNEISLTGGETSDNITTYNLELPADFTDDKEYYFNLVISDSAENYQNAYFVLGKKPVLMGYNFSSDGRDECLHLFYKDIISNPFEIEYYYNPSSSAGSGLHSYTVSQPGSFFGYCSKILKTDCTAEQNFYIQNLYRDGNIFKTNIMVYSFVSECLPVKSPEQAFEFPCDDDIKCTGSKDDKLISYEITFSVPDGMSYFDSVHCVLISEAGEITDIPDFNSEAPVVKITGESRKYEFYFEGYKNGYKYVSSKGEIYPDFDVDGPVINELAYDEYGKYLFVEYAYDNGVGSFHGLSYDENNQTEAVFYWHTVDSDWSSLNRPEAEIRQWQKETVKVNVSVDEVTDFDGTKGYSSYYNTSLGEDYKAKLPVSDFADGTYIVAVEMWDVDGNSTIKQQVVVKKSAPELTINSSGESIAADHTKADDESCSYVSLKCLELNSSDKWEWSEKSGSALKSFKGYFWKAMFSSYSLKENNIGAVVSPVTYKYVPDGTKFTDTNCSLKNAIEGLAGLSILCDRPCFVQTIYSTFDWGTNIDDWEVKVPESQKINPEFFETSGQYSLNTNSVPTGSYYCVVVHFADGTSIKTDAVRK